MQLDAGQSTLGEAFFRDIGIDGPTIVGLMLMKFERRIIRMRGSLYFQQM
jgi:hypothetical protein